MTNYCVCVGRHAKDLRLTQELTRKQLAERALISVGTIERIEAGVQVTKLITLVNLARGLGVTPTFLFTPQSGQNNASGITRSFWRRLDGREFGQSFDV